MRSRISSSIVLVCGLLLVAVAVTPVGAHPEQTGDPAHDDNPQHHFPEDRDPSDALEQQDALSELIVSPGPTGNKTRNMVITGRGERLAEQVTTDVWAHRGFAYIGTFNVPCGTGENFVPGVGPVTLVQDVEAPGVPIFDVSNKNKPEYVGNLPSVEGSRSNDVKVARFRGMDILVHSNESCAGGEGGVELYDVTDPANPSHLASVRSGDLNPTLLALGGVVDAGVHNSFFFQQGNRFYVASYIESFFHNFQIFEITDPTAPELVGAWGSEELFDPGVGDSDDPDRILTAIFDWLQAGFGASQNRFLHDITIAEQGTRAYLSNWDAGLVLLDISDVSQPEVISVALEPEAGSPGDGEVNSHSAWPNEDGSIVVEGEEDFSAWEGTIPPSNLTFGEGDPPAPLPGTAIATEAGDDFEANQTGNTATVEADSVEVTAGPLAGNTYAAIELAGDQPKFADVGPVTGEAVWIGRACNGDTLENTDAFDPGDIAIVRRGFCTFREKNFNAATLDAGAIVIANNQASTPWSGLRIWDYSDPANPVLASTFDTVCSASTEPAPPCDPAGTYSSHNVIVEEQGNHVLAYISWYWDGMLVLDVTDPYNPREIARFFDNSPEFIEANGGNPHDFWGVHKLNDQPTIYGSDRNGGLYLFKLTGRGND